MTSWQNGRSPTGETRTKQRRAGQLRKSKQGQALHLSFVLVLFWGSGLWMGEIGGRAASPFGIAQPPSLPNDDQALLDALGLEPSEAGQLLDAAALDPGDPYLFLALNHLQRRPFRLLHALPWNDWEVGPRPGPVDRQPASRLHDGALNCWRVTGRLDSIVRHHVPVQSVLPSPTETDTDGPDRARDASRNEDRDEYRDGDREENRNDKRNENRDGERDENQVVFYECLIWPESTEAPDRVAIEPLRVLSLTIPAAWQALPWHVETPTRAVWRAESQIRRPRVAALLITLGHKIGIGSESDPSDSENPTTETSTETRWLTGLAKRLEWPESDLEILRQLATHDPGVAASSFPRGTTDDSQTDTVLRATQLADWIALGELGFDLGLWDLVAQGHRRELLPGDNEAFYQLLRIIQAVPKSGEELPLRQAILAPHSLVGRRFQVHAVVKQITQVPNDPLDRGAQMGIPHYYLLHTVVSLPRPLRLKFDAQRQLEYDQHFPLIIAVRRLPPGMAVGEDVRQWIQCEGVFFKLWSYQSQRSQAAGLPQWAPLLVADLPLSALPPPDPAGEWPIGWMLLIPLGLSLLYLLSAAFSWRKPRS